MDSKGSQRFAETLVGVLADLPLLTDGNEKNNRIQHKNKTQPMVMDLLP
ncbi:MAG: hypothetical protein LBC20_04990 [Planctomycetaceae bacterium]|jgi:hypothetical protein|nr:hypothetical protein [Planctomycetaceae bacterium]